MVKNKSVLIAGVLVLLTGVAAVTWIMTRPSAPNTYSQFTDDAKGNEAFDSEVIIGITNSGFEPSSVSIKPRTRVTFVNQDSAKHTVAQSAPDSSSKFGTDASLDPEGRYSFTFTKAGTYNFHDIQNPTANGEIKVSDK